MARVYITETELARDLHAVLAKMRAGIEIIVEDEHKPVAVIRSPRRSGRPISECIASAHLSGSNATLDEGFSKDVEDGIKRRESPWTPPSWE